MTPTPTDAQIEAIRERHAKAQQQHDAPGAETLNATQGWCTYNAWSAHADRATLLSALAAEKACADQAVAEAAATLQALRELRARIYSECDASNWDSDGKRGDTFQAWNDATELFHFIAEEYDEPDAPLATALLAELAAAKAEHDALRRKLDQFLEDNYV